jgi:predicted nucleic acid-binding protein
MRLVLDSSVGIKWFLAEADSDKALQIRDGFAKALHELVAPDIYPVEVAHSLTRAERQLRLTPAEGLSHFQDMFATLPSLHPHLPLLPRAYEISSQSHQGVYDCLYVALAERERCILVTADQRLINRLQPGFPFITPLVSFP